jgi:elongation factor G
VALERLARKFGVNVDTEDVRVAYRETITGTAEAEGKYKKQSGGHGQFAVWPAGEPTRAGRGLRVRRQDRGRRRSPATTSRRSRRASSRRCTPAACTASRSSTCGWSCFDGKYHSRRLLGDGFKMAGSIGFKDAMAKAGVVVLEPVSWSRSRCRPPTRAT